VGVKLYSIQSSKKAKKTYTFFRSNIPALLKSHSFQTAPEAVAHVVNITSASDEDAAWPVAAAAVGLRTFS